MVSQRVLSTTYAAKVPFEPEYVPAVVSVENILDIPLPTTQDIERKTAKLELLMGSRIGQVRRAELILIVMLSHLHRLIALHFSLLSIFLILIPYLA